MPLLNVCCAACCLPVLENQKRFSLFFYSPNIHPREEYDRRLDATIKVAVLYGVKLLIGEYDHAEWLEYVKENILRVPESYPENSARCLACFAYRIDRTAAFSQKKKIPEFALTLSASRFKNREFINSFGESTALKYGLNYQPLTPDPDRAHQISLQLSRQHGIYRQKYCGCEFSLKD
jgi:predicted adenine nucleotide alpha hydrolase (AANH) superfamily ATPase